MDQALISAAEAAGACAHCGLGSASGGRYCCYGCELAAELAREAKDDKQDLHAVLTFSLLLAMIVMMLSLFLFAEDVYGVTGDTDFAWMRRAYRVASLVLSTPVVVMLGVPLAKRALENRPLLSMDLLISAGAAAAYLLSVANVLRGRREVYFDSATSALVLTTLGRYLESVARARASRVVLPSVQAGNGEAMVVREDGTIERVRAASVLPAMILAIEPEGVVPVDCKILSIDGSGPASVNLAVITGAVIPVALAAGDEVPAGAVAVSAGFRCVALRPARESTLERLAELARGLRERPSKLQRAGDAFAAALIPVVAVVAALAFFLGARVSIEQGMLRALAVLLAACPCTYGVATPLVLWLGLQRALEKGVCIRDAEAFERLAATRHVVFDKTGTLTSSELGATVAEPVPMDALGVVLAMEAELTHPVARALRAHAIDRGASAAALRSRRVIAGRGVEAIDGEGAAWLLGSPAWLAERGVDVAGESSEGVVRVALAREGLVVARFHVAERARPEAREAIEEVRALGASVRMLTGDGEAGAEAIATELGIEARALLGPEDKLELTRALGGGVAMVGDGFNDAPALAGSAIGIAMSGATSLSRGVARVALSKDDLRLVPWAIALARRVMKIGYENLALSTIYNVVFIGLATAGALRPVWAGLSMITSSLLVLASSLRARTSKEVVS